MKRYIDANKLKKSLYIPYTSIIKISEAIMAQIDAQQTANVRENVKGEWIKRIDHLDYGLIEFEGFECSLCGVKIWKDDYENVEFKFCPNCGADMRGN